MRTFITIFLVALMVTAISTPRFRRLAVNLGFVDTPDERKVHRDPIPLMGGMAIIFGALLAMLVVVFFTYEILPRSVTGVLLSSGVVALTGLIDDRLGLPAWAKLAGQFCGFIILVYFGIRVQLPIPEPLNYVITFLWLAGISNAINFMDNMDGLSAGVSAVAASFMLLFGTVNEQFLVAALAAAIFGACVGFLRYNFKPARIYMGDAGALFLGFLLAVLGIQLRFPENSYFVTWMVPVLVLGLPIFDMILVVFSRLRRGVSPNTPGKDHTSHRLVGLGLSQRETVLGLYLVSGALGMIAIFVTQARIREGYLLGALVLLMALYAIWQLDFRSASPEMSKDRNREL